MPQRVKWGNDNDDDDNDVLKQTNKQTNTANEKQEFICPIRTILPLSSRN